MNKKIYDYPAVYNGRVVVIIWSIEDSGETDPHWDAFWCELNADINSAENERSISKEQADYLRRIYLRMEEEAE